MVPLIHPSPLHCTEPLTFPGKVSTLLSARIGRLAPAWNEPQTPADYDAQFAKAMALAGAEFLTALTDLHQQWLPARAVVLAAVNSRLEVDASGEIIRVAMVCPWKAHLYDIEGELAAAGVLVRRSPLNNICPRLSY